MPRARAQYGRLCPMLGCDVDLSAPHWRRSVLWMFAPHARVRCGRVCPTLGCNAGVLLRCLPHAKVQYGPFCPTLVRGRAMEVSAPHMGCYADVSARRVYPTLGCDANVSAPQWGAMRTCLPRANTSACCGCFCPRVGVQCGCVCPRVGLQCGRFCPTPQRVVDVSTQR